MNRKKLRDAEALFFQMYPGGFEDDALAVIRKKHNVGRLSDLAATALTRKRFLNRSQVLDDIVRIVTRSSMVSLFEKPKFRDYVNGLSQGDREVLAEGYKKLLHGNRKNGFNQVLEVLTEAKLAKWSLMTIIPYQYRPEQEYFVKPTTTKNVIRQFELQGLEYRPRPSWDFYNAYREALDDMKGLVSPALAPSNAAFTGFLMMTTGVGQQ